VFDPYTSEVKLTYSRDAACEFALAGDYTVVEFGEDGQLKGQLNLPETAPEDFDSGNS
jgi:hypothetical protein